MLKMMHRLRRYDVFRFAQNDVARFTRNDVMFATMCRQAHIIREANIIRQSQHHLRDRQTSFKKCTFGDAIRLRQFHTRKA